MKIQQDGSHHKGTEVCSYNCTEYKNNENESTVNVERSKTLLECGPMPNVIAALPRPLRKFRNSIPCTTSQTLADAHCSSAVQ